MKRIAILLGLLLSACDPTPPPQPETERKLNPAFETQIQAMKKARAVEQQARDATDAQRQHLEAGTPP